MDSNHRSPARKSRFLLRKTNCGTERGAAKKGCFGTVKLRRFGQNTGARRLSSCRVGRAAPLRRRF
jgi:hypothetical protein